MTEAARQAKRAALALGFEAERFVASALVAAGWQVVAERARAGGGELDLIVQRGRALRFVEVKARTASGVHADDVLPAAKRATLNRAAEAWLADQGDAVEEAFDEVAWLLAVVDVSADPWQLDVIDSPFDGG